MNWKPSSNKHKRGNSMSRTVLPELGPNPFEEALANYNTLIEQLAATKTRLEDSKLMATDMLRENDFLKEQLCRVGQDRDRLQAYSIELTARIDVIIETADNAKNAARRFAVKMPMQPVEDTHHAAPEASVAEMGERFGAGREPIAEPMRVMDGRQGTASRLPIATLMPFARG
jgi:hypothetical protein